MAAIPKTDLYQNLKSKSFLYDEKPVAVFSDKANISLENFFDCYDGFKEFYHSVNITNWNRIAVISEKENLVYLLSFPIMDYAVVVPCECDLTKSDYETYFRNVNLDYIVTDDLDCNGVKVAEDFGIGIISIKTQNSTEFEFSLINEKIMKKRLMYPDEYKFVMIKTTSGTTGNPKVLPVTSDSLLSTTKRVNIAFENSENDVTLMVTSVYKALTITRMFYSLYHCGTTVFMGNFNHEMLLNVINDYSVNNFTASPAVLSSLCKYIENDSNCKIKSKLRFLRASGAPLTNQLKQRLEKVFKTQIIVSYGTHETLNISCSYNNPKGFKDGSVGISTGLELKVHDGEILVKGEAVFPGYVGENNAEAQFSDGWFHTGDAGYIDEDGYIFITGRIKEMINRGGEKISPYEVEGYLVKHPEIIDAAVFPYQDASSFESVGAVLVTSENIQIQPEHIRKFLTGSISAYMMPTKIYITDEIPISKNGKVQRKQLYNQLEALNIKTVDEIKNTEEKNNRKLSKTEKIIKKIISSELNKNDIGVDDGFIDIGGDSLNGASILSHIEKKLNVIVPIDTLFSNGTIEKIASYVNLNKNKWKDYDFLVPAKESGIMKPLIMVPTADGNTSVYNQLIKIADSERPIIGINFKKKSRKWKYPLSFEQIATGYIDELLKYDPDGPYNLFGFCFGGVLAMEMANQLKSRGYEVGMLVMLDSVSRAIIKKKPMEKGAVKRTVTEKYKISKKQLSNIGLKEKTRLLIKKIKSLTSMIFRVLSKKLYWVIADKNIKFLLPLLKSENINQYAFLKYMPSKYKGSVYFIRTTENKHDVDRYKFWEPYFDEFNVIEMDLIHNDLIKDNGADILMKHLNSIMEDLDV